MRGAEPDSSRCLGEHDKGKEAWVKEVAFSDTSCHLPLVLKLALSQAGGRGGAEPDSDSDSDGGAGFYSEGDEAWVEEHASAEDEAALAAFLNPGMAGAPQRTLSDIIMLKIQERQAAGGLAPVPECAPVKAMTARV